MSLNRIGGRFIIKKTNVSGEIPTISSYDTHESGKWINTDIYEGELYINTTDNKLWFRNNNNEIIEIPTLNTSNLKIKEVNLPDMFGRLTYFGLWDANTNTYPNNSSIGNYYIINNSGVIDGMTYIVGDFIIFNGKFWDKIDNTKKIINTSDIVFHDNIKLDEFLNKLTLPNIENELISKKLSIIDEGYILTVDKNNFLYKKNPIYHNGNSNNFDVNWTANKLTSKLLESDKISSDTINSSDINTKSIKTENLVVSNGRIEFDNKSNYILGNGKGISFNYLNEKIIEYKSSSDIIITSRKIRYNTEQILDNELDIVNKKWVDDRIDNTYNVNISDLFSNEIIIYKGVRYINIDIDIDGNFELILDDIEKNNNTSSMVTICIETLNSVFELSIKSFDDEIIKINEIGIISLYFNNNNNKWYNI